MALFGKLRLERIEHLDLRSRTAVEISEIRRRFDYVVLPGYVTSQNDGDRHYITAERLIELYGVDPRRCIVVDRSRPHMAQGIHWSLADLPQLKPRSDGNYTTPLDKTRLRETIADLPAGTLLPQDGMNR